jgi:Fic family protein
MEWKKDIADIHKLQSNFERLYQKKALIQSNRPLPASVLQKIRENLTIEWTYNSNSIEGNTLSLRETQMVLQEGMTIKGKSLQEHFEAHNHKKAINYLHELIKDDYILRAIDGLVLQNIEDEFAGRLRNGGVRIVGANFTPPNANKVSDLLDELIEFINTNSGQLNDILLSTLFHHRLVWIHPFFDGNGRTARLAMNLLLMRNGFPPAIILKNDRKKYYEALNQANKGSYYKLCLMMCQALERSVNIYLNAMPHNANDYVSIASLVPIDSFGYSQEYLSLLARQGKIDAYKEGRNWLTTKQAIDDYLKGKRK